MIYHSKKAGDVKTNWQNEYHIDSGFCWQAKPATSFDLSPAEVLS